MTTHVLPARSEIAPEHTWNSPSLFESHAAWEAEYVALSDAVPTLPSQFKGRLAEGPAVLADYYDTFYALYIRLGKVYVYAGMFSEVDTADQQAAMMEGRAMGLFSQLIAGISFAEPELLAIGRQTITRWLSEESRLTPYAHYFDDLFRRGEHVRSAEVEEILGLVSDPFGQVPNTASQLANADIKFQAATMQSGESISVEQGNVARHLNSPDRQLRRSAHESYMDGYLAFKNTFASNMIAAIKRDVFYARARRHTSSLEAALFPYNIPEEVFHNLINTFRANLPTWHRYWDIRRRALGLDRLALYDGWAPLTGSSPTVPYTQAVEWISAGMAPLGQEYVDTLRRGCLVERWVDVYPNRGKRQGAFSSGWKGTLPFIMMSYNDTLVSMSTLAHELGHSMHSYLTWKHQPAVYSDYSLFVAEVASNFNQAMVRAHLLKISAEDRNFQIAVIEEAMSNFLRYFFIMPTLARFELEAHERIERGEGLSSDSMIDLMAGLLAEGYGGAFEADHDRDGIMWATFNHLYANFYVFQYATGISAAHALSQGILDGKPGAVDNYLSFLKAGSSLYPLDALKLAGVDMASPAAVEKTFAVMAGYVDRLEKLV
ncbi:MAG: oligoendopeptidase F [Chloroflexi bacterium]|nr:oligoendopeptidase F [Chloroflexota bacterium]